MKRSLLAALILLATLANAQDHLRVVVTGDNRWDTHGGRAGDENGVNVAGFTKVITSILNEKPSLVIFNGDTIGGGTDEEEASQFQTFLKVVQPLYDAHIKVLTVRGNHEMHAPHATEVWRKAFSGPYANPQNGPAGEEDLTFSYEAGNCLFLGLDQFTSKTGINQPWIDTQLASSHAAHVFAFAHKMAFLSGNHTDGMNQTPEVRETFISSLAPHGGLTLFFGHDHLYDHVTARKADWPAGRVVHQIVVGTAGAPFAHGRSSALTDGNFALNHLGHVEDKLGYCVVDVEGATVTVRFMAESTPGKFDLADSFSYSVPKQ